MMDRPSEKRAKGRPPTRRELLEELEDRRKRIASLERVVECLRSSEKALVECEEHSRSLFDRMPMVYHMLDTQGRVITANDLWLALYGFSREEVVGRRFSDFLVEEHRIEFEPWLSSVALGKETEETRVTIRRGDGNTVDVEIRALRDCIESTGAIQIHCISQDISEQHRLVDAVRHGEGRYRSTIDSITDALHVVDRDLRLVLINRAFLEWHETLGLPTDVIGKRLQDLYDFLPPQVEKEYGRVFETGKALVTEEISRVGEADIVTETRKIPVLEDGDVVKVITIVRDITDRKCMEDALRQSEANFKTLADQSPNMIFVNSRGRIAYVNRKCVDVMGYTREEFYSPDFDFFCLIAPESVDSVVEGYSVQREGRKEYSRECTLVTKAGRKMECIVTFAVVGYGDGDALLGVATDITARKRAEQALRVSEKKYRSFAENFHGIAYGGGLDGTPIFFHGDVQRITGYSEEDFLSGVPKWVDIVLLEDRSEFEGGFTQESLLGVDHPLELEYRIRRKDGRIRWIHQSIKPLVDSSGDVIYLQGALYDVTERRVAEDMIARERSAFGIIADAAMKSGNITEVCERVLSGLTATLGFDCGTVRLYDAEARVLRLVAAHGLTPGEVRQHVHDQHIDDSGYVAALVGRTRKPIWAPDVSACDDLKGYRKRLAEVRIRSIISWPLISPDGTLVGVMHLLGRRPVSIPEEDRDFFQAVSEMFVIVLDRKRAEEDIKASEALLKETQQLAKLGGWEWDVEKGSGVWTDGVCRIFEVTEDADVGLFATGFEAYPAEARPAIREAFEKAIKERKPYDLELPLTTAKGKHKWVRTIGLPHVVEGKTIKVTGYIMDITEQKRAETALRESEARYRGRFESSPIALWEEDFSGAKNCIDSLRESGVGDFEAYFEEHPEAVIKCAESVKIIAANKAAMDLYDTMTLGEFARVSTGNIRARTLDAFRKGLTLVAEGVTEFDLDYQTSTVHGEDRFVRLRWFATPGFERNLEHVLVSVVDLTERKEAEEIARRAEIQLRRYSEELEEMVRDRTARIRELERQRAESEKLAATGRMAARIAHEINNPLAGIKNSFLLLRDIMDKEHPHYQYAERVQKEIDRIAHIIRKMFDLYRPDISRRTEVCVDEVIRDVIGIMESTFRAGGIEAALELPETPVRVPLPVGYVNQVLFNLIQNAAEASNAGDTVTISLRTERDSVIVEVRDQGGGIPDKIGGRIFEPFFTTKSDGGGKGLGLGLAVSKGMVEAMGGGITFEDNSPKGTIFTVSLPLHKQTEEV